MNITDAHDLNSLMASRYLLDELPPAERLLFEQHLEQCESCKEEVLFGGLFVTALNSLMAERLKKLVTTLDKEGKDLDDYVASLAKPN